MTITSRQSFERRLKRKGIRQPDVKSSNTAKLFEQFKGLDFCIWDKQEHTQRCIATNNGCCFNHAIGLPQKAQESKPLFDYEYEIYNALQQTRNIWIKKAT